MIEHGGLLLQETTEDNGEERMFVRVGMFKWTPASIEEEEARISWFEDWSLETITVT